MRAAELPPDEQSRLARLRDLAVLDTAPEPLFDALTQAVVAVTGKPIALISLIDADRQWFKSNTGLAGIRETDRDDAFCAHTIVAPALLEVPDARGDPQFADSSLVTDEPNIRFYASAPITLSDGLRMGSLCVMDHEPGALDDRQRQVLVALAGVAAEALELRRYAIDEHAAHEREAEALREQRIADEQLGKRLRASETFLERTGRLAGVGGWELDLASEELVWSAQTCRIHNVPPGYQPTVHEAVNFYAVEFRPVIRAAMDKAIADGDDWDLQLPLVTATGRKIWVRAVGEAIYGDDGEPRLLAGAFQDVTLRARAVAALEASDLRYRKLFEHSMGLICTHDHEGILLSVNPATAKSLGYSIGELIGRPLTDFILPTAHGAFKAYLLRMFRKDTDTGILQLIAKDGSVRTWEYHNVLDDEGDEPYVLGHAHDITERRHYERQLHEWSMRDQLTGCYNRRYLAGLRENRSDERWGCIVIDLDRFKQINDTHGHQRGDEVLIGMAEFLRAHVRPRDAVVRMGGDEFLVLLREADDQLTASVVERIDTNRQAAPIAFTLGAVTLAAGQSLDAGLAEADRRLYKKREGRPEVTR